MLLLLVLAAAGACDESPQASDAAPTNQADAGTQPPATPAGARLTWVLAALNGAPVSVADANANFTTGFLAQVPVAQLQAVFAQLAAAAPWTLMGLDGPSTPSSLVAIVRRGDGQYWRIVVQTSPAESDRMNGLFLAPAGDLDPTLASFAAIDDAVQELAPAVNLLVASVDASGGCTSLHALHPEASLAIGSTFKLYVLAALAASIEAGQREWTDTIAIQDQYKSLPSGDLQDQPVGTLLPVLTFAEKMISISDNTATDHLLFTVGREAVETMLTTARHHEPALDVPFIGTRELFTLKLMLSPAEQDAYVAASVDEKRTLLAGYAATRDPRTYTGTWTTPLRIDTLEWFASPDDLCNVMATLKGYGEQPATAPVHDVLALNPGLPDPGQAFTYIGFKGGSEPGVLNLTWLVQRASDQEWRFLSLGFNDTTKDVPTEQILYVAGAARALLAE